MGLLLAGATEGAPPDAATTHAGLGAVEWACTPARVPACREVTVSCAVRAPEDGWDYTWDFGDGGGAHAGPALRRVLPAGVVGYAVRLTARRGEETWRDRRVLALDRATLVDCPGLGTAPDLPALPDRPAGALRVAVISDSNGPYGSIPQGEDAEAAVRALTDRVRPDLVVHAGDMVAGQKRGLSREAVAAMWEGYREAVAAPLAAAGIPLLPVPGNHDAAHGKRLIDRDVYAAFWSEPGRRPSGPVARTGSAPGGRDGLDIRWIDADGWPFRWAATIGGTLLVALDAPTGRVSADDVRWLAGILAGAPDARPRLVFAHVPPWQPTDRAYGTLGRWDDLARVLREGDVAALVTGHYEVFFPTVLDGVQVVLDGTLARACAPRKDLTDGLEGCRCRPLAGSTLCQGTTFVVFDIRDGAVVRRFAAHGPEFDHVLPAALLPDEVRGQSRAAAWE